MTSTPPGVGRSYESTYRRTELALPFLLAVLAFFAGSTTAIVLYVDGRNLEKAIFGLAGVTLVLMVLVLLTGFRRHRWTIREDGIEILQRPGVPLTGLSRRVTVRYPDIAAFRNVESGVEHLVEITTRHGDRFRLSQALIPGHRGIGRPDPAADLGTFAASIRDTAARAGHALPAMSEGLSFWNSPLGLTFLSIMFALSLLISGTVAWALWEGMTVSPRPRGGEALAILLLLPVGAGWLLRRSWKRRATVQALSKRTLT